MSTAEIFQHYHPLLFAIAYRMTGSVHDAEDVVQDTFVSWLCIDTQKVENVKAYLITSVKNRALAFLAEVKRARQVDWDTIAQYLPWNKATDSDLLRSDFPTELRQRCAVMVQRLTPSEQSVVLLKGVFDLKYTELSELVGKNTSHCRQLWCRAQQHLLNEKARFQLDPQRVQSLYDRLLLAYNGEGFSSLMEWLKQEEADVNKKSA